MLEKARNKVNPCKAPAARPLVRTRQRGPRARVTALHRKWEVLPVLAARHLLIKAVHRL